MACHGAAWLSLPNGSDQVTVHPLASTDDDDDEASIVLTFARGALSPPGARARWKKRTMKLYYADDLVQLYHGDCQFLLPTLPRHRRVLVLTDPPWGSKTRVDNRAFAPRTGMGGIRLP